MLRRGFPRCGVFGGPQSDLRSWVDRAVATGPHGDRGACCPSARSPGWSSRTTTPACSAYAASWPGRGLAERRRRRAGRAGGGHPAAPSDLVRSGPSCLTASRSSASSATEASIRPREKSSMSRPCTICVPAVRARDREGGDQALGHAVASRRRAPPSTPSRRRRCRATQSRTWSMAALAADAADEAPRASMIAAPRFCTVGMKSFSSQSWSSDDLGGVLARRPRRGRGRGTGWPSGCPRSSSCVMSVTVRAGLGGELGDRPVVVEPGHGGEALRRRCPARCSWR